MADTPTSEALRFSVESVGFAPATTDTVLVRVRGTWHAGARRLGAPLLVVEEGGDSRAFAMLPGGGRVPASGPAGALWSAGFAVPAELARRASARWSLRAGEVTAALPSPSELARAARPRRARRPTGAGARSGAAPAALSPREEVAASRSAPGGPRTSSAPSATGRSQPPPTPRPRGPTRASWSVGRAPQTSGRPPRRPRPIAPPRASPSWRRRSRRRTSALARRRRWPAWRRPPRPSRRRQAETVAASAREARQVAEQRAAEIARAAQRREAELRAELATVQRRLDELEAGALLRAAN